MLNKKRDSGVELLRIFAICLVIGVHLFSYGGFYGAAKSVGGHVHAAALLMKLATRSAVDIFVLITGFFMAERPFELKKGLRRSLSVYQKMFFYSVVLTVLFLLLGREYLVSRGSEMASWRVVLKGLLPVSSQTWYFLTDYLLLCLLIPFLNLGLQLLTKKEYRVLLCVLAALMSLFATAAPMRPFKFVFETFGYANALTGKNVFHFIFIYILGGYICFNHTPRKRPNFWYLGGAAGTLALNYLLLTRLPAYFSYGAVAQQYSNPLVIANAVFLLLFFKDLHFHSGIVNALASTTLGVYAISEFRFVRTLLWKWIHFKKADVGNVFKNFVMVVGGILAVFLVCAAIDLLREQLFRFVARWRGQRAHKKIEKAE